MPANKACIIDQIRMLQGIPELRNIFVSYMKNDLIKASGLLNEDGLNFGSLFALRNEIASSNIRLLLSKRNQTALKLTELMLIKDSANIWKTLRNSRTPNVTSTLKWMLCTGYRDDGLCREFDELLDCTASILAKSCKGTLPVIELTDLLFKRYRRGGYYYDLVWVLFEACKVNSLNILAKRLLSNHFEDIDLTRKLLAFIPCIHDNLSLSPDYQYRLVLKWIVDNQAYLRYTGESFQQTRNPIPFILNKEK